ncbi:MAG: thiamine pyrophosphate-binding protein [Chlamydiales bacterium]|nr:thiamine pyrophosphate-binding protein [Chlamydiales bacterium]
MKLADYVVDFFVKQGISHNFLVSGGAVIHLVDSTAKHDQIMPVCVQHEEHGAAAADMYARVTGNLGLTMTTSGPGATNIVTSVCNAYTDSIPMVCITGQVSTFRIKKSEKLRQRGFQETDVVSIFSSITKYAKLIRDPLTIRYELEKAVYIAKEGRPGPVLLDIPDDLQRVDIDPDNLVSYMPSSELPVVSNDIVRQLFQMIADSKRPVFVIGAGVHCAKVEEAVTVFLRHFKVPVLLTWGAFDLLAFDDELNMGGVGVCGPRAGNFAVQNADLVVAMGTRLSPMITGGKQNLFAPGAKKIMIDVDEEELKKFDKDTFVLDLQIHSDLGKFFKVCESFYIENIEDRFSSWRKLIHEWMREYPVCNLDDYHRKDRVNPYVFIKEMSGLAKEGDIIIADTGANVSWTLQAFETKKRQRIFSAWNHTPMGYSLPASVGAAFATKEDVICIIGDGGLMMCLQELATARRHNLPIKIFIFDNKGHGIQKQTIDTWLNSHYVAVDEASGLYFPDYHKLAESFHIPYFCIRNHSDLLSNFNAIWNTPGLFICNVEMIENQKIVPMLKFGAGLEDLDPKLPKEELAKIMSQCMHLAQCEVDLYTS